MTSVREALLQKLCGDARMYSLGCSIARVVAIASSEQGGTKELARYVLSDAALSQRVLSLANQRQAATTVARAIAVLGVDAVKAVALSMLLVEAMPNGRQASAVKAELETALRASLVARSMARHVAANQIGGDMARHSFAHCAEEACVVALLKNIGPVLLAAHEHERYNEIRTLRAGGRFSAVQAAQMILGCNYDALSHAVLQQWKLPASIVACAASLPVGVQKPASNRQEALHQLAGFGVDTARAMLRSGLQADMPDTRGLVQRYGQAFEIDAKALQQLAGSTNLDMDELLRSMNMRAEVLPEENHIPCPAVMALACMEEGAAAAGATEQLRAGTQRLAGMRASGDVKLSEVMRVGLESLYHSMDCRFAVLCLKDLQRKQYRGRLALGEDSAQRREQFAIPVAPAPDIFHLAMERDIDLVISNVATNSIAKLRPLWHRMLLPDARSFVVLPLVVGKAKLGFVYADRAHADQHGISPEETGMIKALKAELLAALGG